MSTATLFALVFVATVLVTRIVVYLIPRPSPTTGGFRTHHWMWGALLAMISVACDWLIPFAVGFGLFVDELAYILIRGKDHKDNYSPISLIGTACFTILFVVLRTWIVTTLGFLK